MPDISPEFTPPQPITEKVSSGKNADKSVKTRLKRIARNALLAGLVMAPGAINDANISMPNIKDPTPAVAPSPDFKSQSADKLQPYTPQPSIETSTLTPTPEPTSTPSTPNPPENETIQKENKELIPYSPSITIIDAAPSVPTKGLIQKEYISNNEMIRNMLGDKYVSKEQIIQEFGQDYEKKWDEVVSKYPQALVHRFADTYFTHGEKVTRVLEHTLERSEFKSTGVNILPLQRTFDADSIKFIKDSSGNPGVSLNFDPKRIIKLLENDPSRVINGSFQVGNVELFQETKVDTEVIPKYDLNDPRFSTSGINDPSGSKFYPGAVGGMTENGRIVYRDAEGKEVEPILMSGDEYAEEVEKRRLENSEIKEHKSTSITIVGAYAKEKAMENLPKLFKVCNAYPNKFFVFAGGNTGEDFREAMETLKDQVPKNLLITAEWEKGNYGGFEYEGPAGTVYGADIYVSNTASGSPHGSSFSVPELSAEIDVLLSLSLIHI